LLRATTSNTIIREGSSVVTPISGDANLNYSPFSKEDNTPEAGGRLTDKERATVVYQEVEEEKKSNADPQKLNAVVNMAQA
jgi:hypothetical protein